LVQALALPPTLSGQKIAITNLELLPPPQPIRNIQTGTRIGISKAKDKQWRFYI